MGPVFERGQIVVWHTQQPERLLKIISEAGQDPQGCTAYTARRPTVGTVYIVSASEMRPLADDETLHGWKGD